PGRYQEHDISPRSDISCLNLEGKPTADSHQQCHAYCGYFLTCQKSWNCIQVTAYKHPITPHEKIRRCQWLKTKLITSLSNYHNQKRLYLPNEIWSLVAKDLLHCYATINTQVTQGQAARYQVNLNHEVWCKFTTFEGMNYLSSLSNTPLRGSTAISSPAVATRKYMYLAENYLGITELRLLSSPTQPQVDATPGIWWQEIEVDSEVTVQSDGTKLRRIFSQDKPSTVWSVLPSKKPRFAYFSLNIHQPLRMGSLVCNDPSTVAYSVLWHRGISMIHAHTAKDDLSFYKLWPEGLWVYMPLEKNEVIRELWQRRSPLTRRRGLMLITSMERTFIAGTYLGQLAHNSPWTLIEKLEPLPRRIHVEVSDKGIGVLGFESPKPEPAIGDFADLDPPPNPINTNLRDYLSTKHSLEALQEITPCRKGQEHGISGLLFRYMDGHQECAGEIRLDSLCEPLQPDENGRWSLVFKKKDGRFPFVSAVLSRHCEPDTDLESVINLACSGKLFWIWSRHQCYVLYEGQTSPAAT
ncbi:hypothetical protein S7711_10173, partial [Stachybotrys chartarum IBT 7711]